jgi:hypothetical protein
MNRGIMFFLGLLFGILICVLLFYFDIKIFESKLISNKEKEIVIRTQIDTVYLEVPPKTKKQNIDNQFNDAVEENIDINQSEDEVSIYETAFSFDGVEQDEVFSDKLIKTKTVKIKLLSKEGQEVILPENFFRLFEIQMWSTPIKNKITYFRNQNMLKIKGLEIDYMNVVFWNNAYYLELKERYYSIPETEHFVKLNTVVIPKQE